MDITEVINKVNDGKIPVGYKKEHGYIVPVDWKVVPVRKIATKVERKIDRPNKPYWKVSIKSHCKGTYQSYIEDYNQIKMEELYIVQENDLIVNITFAWEHAIAIADKKDNNLLVSKRFPTFVFQNNVCIDFYRNVIKLKYIKYQLGVFSPGGAGRNRVLNTKLFYNSLYLPYPPLKEQENIAKILQCCNKIITLKEELLNEKEKYKKYVMGEILSGKKRLSGYTDKWKKSELHNLADLNSGGTPTTSHKEYYNGNIKWASISDITSQYKYIYDTKIKITELGLQNSSAKIFPKYTVLFAIYASIGECVITMDEIATSQAILGINCGKKLFYEYLFYVLLAKKNDYQIYAQKGTQSNLNKDIVANFIIFLPSYHEQQAIVNILTKVDNEIELLKKELDLYKEKFKALSQILLTGIVRTNKLSEK